MNKYGKLLSNTFILGIGTFGSKLLVFFMVRFYTGCLTTKEYGIADVITQTANLLIPLLSLGVTEAVFRFAMDKTENKKAVLSSGLFITCCGALFIALITPLFGLISLFDGYEWLIFFYTFCSCIHTVFSQYIRALGKMKEFAIFGLINTAITIALNILFLLFLHFGIYGYVLSVVFSDVLCTLLLVVTEKLYLDIRPADVSFNLIKNLLRYSIPLIPTTVFWWMTNVADRYMVTWMLGSDANGLYAVAYKIPSLLILLSGIFIEAWQFSAVTEQEEEGHEEFFGEVFDSFQALMFIAGCCLTAFSKIAVKIMAAEDYYLAWQYIPVLSVATIFSSLVTFMGSVYLVEKKSVLSFVTAMTGAIINMVLNFLLIPSPLAVNGAAIATFFSYFIVFIIRAINCRHYIRFNMHPVKLVVNTAIACIQVYAMVYEIPHWIIIQAVTLILIFTLNAKSIMRGVFQVFRIDKIKKTKSSAKSSF